MGEAAETESCESNTQCPSKNLSQYYVNTVKLGLKKACFFIHNIVKEGYKCMYSRPTGLPHASISQ